MPRGQEFVLKRNQLNRLPVVCQNGRWIPESGIVDAGTPHSELEVISREPLYRAVLARALASSLRLRLTHKYPSTAITNSRAA